MSLRAAVAVLAAGSALAPVAAAALPADPWQGTWKTRPGAFASKLVLRAAPSVRGTPACPAGPDRRFYSGSYAGARSGSIAACTDGKYSLRASLSEDGVKVGALEVSWQLAVSDTGEVGNPTLTGTATVAGRRVPLSATWSGGGTPSLVPAGGDAKQEAIAAVTASVRRQSRRCELTIGTVTAVRAGKVWAVTVTMAIFGRRDRARWNVVGTKVTPADPLAADIHIGCP